MTNQGGLRSHMMKCFSFRVFPVIVLGLLTCDFDKVDTSDVSATTTRPVRAVVNCLNSIGVELDLDGQTVHLSIRYPQEQVFITGNDVNGERLSDVFDRVYSNCPFDILEGSFQEGMTDRFQRAFPGHGLGAAFVVDGGTVHFRTEDKYMYLVTAKGSDADATMEAFLQILATERPLAEGYFPAVRMRQEIHGEWRVSQRYCLDGFMYYVAPADTVKLEFTVFPLHVMYYADHVELAVPTTQSEPLQVSFKSGVNGIPSAMQELDGLVLQPGQSYRLSFLYKEFFLENADIDIILTRTNPPVSTLPAADVDGGVDPFPSRVYPVSVPPGTPTFLNRTRRSPLLDRALGLNGDPYPPSDETFPDWAREAYYGYFPHRRPR